MKDGDGRSKRARRQREQRQAQILEAAQAVFATRGYHHATVADIIEAAEVSRGTFYLYFDSKAQIFREVLEGFVKQLMDAIIIVEPTAPDATSQIASNIHRVVDLFFDNRYLSIVLLREAVGLDDEVDKTLMRLHEFVLDMVEGAFRNGARWGLIRKVDERIAATALIGSIKEVLYQYLVADNDVAAQRSLVATTLFDLYLRGLRPEPTRASESSAPGKRRSANTEH